MAEYTRSDIPKSVAFVFAMNKQQKVIFKIYQLQEQLKKIKVPRNKLKER